jgi:predicted PurR-regulated permease PerM
MAIIAVLGIAVLAYVLYAAPSILIVALGGMAFAIILSFPVRALSQVMPRGPAILVTFLGLVGLVTLALVFLIPLLVRQLRNFILITPAIANSANDFLLGLIEPLAESELLPAPAEDVVAGLVQNLFDRAREIIEGMLVGLVGFISGALNFGIVVFGMLFVAAYLLADSRRIKLAYLRAAPTRYRHDARDLWDAFEHSFSRYLSGLLLDLFIQGAVSALVLYLIGVPYAIALGAWVFLTGIIPYAGAWLGAIPAVAVALTVSPTATILTLVAFLIIQQVEGNYLMPRIHGKALHIHPVLILLAVIVGGGLAGLLGVLLAVPILAVSRVLYDFFSVRLLTGE